MINILYSVKLKQILIIDVIVIATGFVLRLFVGGYAIDEMITYINNRHNIYYTNIE